MPKISQIEIFKTSIPFKHSFEHSIKKRNYSESIFIKVLLDNGLAGYGEALPRSYVTGNTQDSVFGQLADYTRKLIGTDMGNSSESIVMIKNLEGIDGEARCSLELALLDVLGKAHSRPVSEFLGGHINDEFTYSLVVPTTSRLNTVLICLFAIFQGYKFIKVKVGSAGNSARVGLCRRMMPGADIRIDANGTWDAAQALDAIKKLRAFNISCVEQPTAKNDLNGMQEVADFCPEPVIADESLCTREDALKLAQARICDMFNIRLSKCGGIFRSMDIIKIAVDNGLRYQIGCLVGETGILSAAARQMASVIKDVAYFEGSYSRFLLKEDAVEEDLTPVRSIGYTLKGSGLGVTVREDIIRKYSKESLLVE